MKRRLTKEEIEYVWMHFKHHYSLDEKTTERFTYIQAGTTETDSTNNMPGIFFPLSEKQCAELPYYDENGTLVLYPLATNKKGYEFVAGDLIFNHDYLKSIFYFLSGYRELDRSGADPFGRLPFTTSLQYTYGIPLLPYVKDMMDTLANGIQVFCARHGLPFSKRTLWDNGQFLLSHDIDHIKQYRPGYFKYKIKEIAGIVKNKRYSKIELMHQSIVALISTISGQNDPAWSFNYIQKINQEFDTKSTYFFLSKEGHRDGTFDISSPKVQKLVQSLKNQDQEVAVHGTMASHQSIESAQVNLNKSQNLISETPGIRQHWLAYHFPTTTEIHQSLSYRYDATLGFHDQTGFRHGYCFPFKLWDFDNQKPFDQWEIPLCVMDVTMLVYMGMTLSECVEEVDQWIKVVNEKKGLFSLLWHNTTLNEIEVPGVKKAYQTMVKRASDALDNKTHGEVANFMATLNV